LHAEALATRAASQSGGRLGRIDSSAVCAWVLAGALVLYLAFDGGGYGIAAHSQVGIIVWWIVVVCSAWGLLPVRRLTRPAWIVLSLFAGFVGWTALATTWSISSGRSLQDLGLVTCYLGVLVLAVAIHRERRSAVRHTVGAVAVAVTLVAALAIASRFWPHLFSGSLQTGAFLQGAKGRLSWPLNYWNALAAFAVMGIPLLLSLATSARTLAARAAAAASVPIVALSAALTLARGGVIVGALGVLVFLLFAPGRIPKLATTLTAAAGSALLIAGAFERTALWQALTNRAESRDATAMVIEIVIVCIGVALVQLGITLADRHGTPPRLMTISVQRARLLALAGVVAIVAVALAAGAPSHLSRAWHNFKVVGAHGPPSTISRFGATSGDGRYQYWIAAVHSTAGHVAGGSGPGTFQQLWLPRAGFRSYVQNAHSLYFETLAEVGAVGLLLIVGFLVAAVVAAIALITRTRFEERTLAAGALAAMVAFVAYAGFDWVWQVPVLPAIFLLLTGAIVAPGRSSAGASEPADAATRTGSVGRLPWGRTTLLRGAAVVVGIVAIFAIVSPLATSTALSRSQAAAADGNVSAALADARQAVQLEPGTAAPELQLALVLELAHAYPQALVAARQAVRDESQNWSNWLTLSRLEAESGHADAAVSAYLTAKRLNPQSPLFRDSHATA
jgi:hypothetical protein